MYTQLAPGPIAAWLCTELAGLAASPHPWLCTELAGFAALLGKDVTDLSNEQLELHIEGLKARRGRGRGSVGRDEQ